MHSFHAYIDESGDEGFRFADFPERKSSEWFVLGAVVVRQSRSASAATALHKILNPIEAARHAPAHFSNLNHDQRVAFVCGISKLPLRATCVCIHKKNLAPGHALATDRRLYRYAARLLLERISWIARDHSNPGEGNGKCKLIFSQVKSLSYEKLFEYFSVLQNSETQVSWPNIDTDNPKVMPHSDSIWLKAADAVCSGVTQGLELSRYGYCEDRFARTIKPVVYCNGQNYRSYGMKFFPGIPAEEPDRDNRYSWLSHYP